MKVRLLDPQKRKQLKAAERAEDKAAQQAGRGAERQKRNAFVPDAKGWTIEDVPAPQEGETLE